MVEKVRLLHCSKDQKEFFVHVRMDKNFTKNDFISISNVFGNLSEIIFDEDAVTSALWLRYGPSCKFIARFSTWMYGPILLCSILKDMALLSVDIARDIPSEASVENVMEQYDLYKKGKIKELKNLMKNGQA